MTAIDLSDLRAKAKAATPGPWEIQRQDQDDGTINYEIWHFDDPKHYARVVTFREATETPRCIHNSKYVAAANPTTLLELLDEIEHMRNALKMAAEALKPFDKLVGDETWSTLHEQNTVLIEPSVVGRSTYFSVEKFRALSAALAEIRKIIGDEQ